MSVPNTNDEMPYTPLPEGTKLSPGEFLREMTVAAQCFVQPDFVAVVNGDACGYWLELNGERQGTIESSLVLSGSRLAVMRGVAIA
jgi:hypothetical protein